MKVSPEELAHEVDSVTKQLQVLADGMAADGMITASGVVLMGRQTIRALWTQLRPAEAPQDAPAAPTLQSVPAEGSAG